jgi:8-oxo-dGTP pyrophosphatase MutT (NUDIX family)
MENNNQVIQKNRRIVIENKWLTLVDDTLNINEKEYNYYHVLKPDTIMMIVIEVVDNETFTYIVNQYRHPIKRSIWQFPMGGISNAKNSNILDCAKRELREETGIIAETTSLINTFYVDPGFSSQRCHVFVASGNLTKQAPELEDSEQDLTAKRVNIKDIPALIQSGEMGDSWGFSGLFHLNQYLAQGALLF